MKNHATRLLIVTGMIVFLIAGGSGCATRSKVTPTTSNRLTEHPAPGFDWYLGNYLVTGGGIQASVVKPTPAGPLAADFASDVGFDWYLGEMLMGSTRAPASNLGSKANADEEVR